MKYKVEEKQSFDVIGVRSSELKPFDPEISNMWHKVMTNGDFEKILNLANTDFDGIHGFCEPTPSGFIYYIASASTLEAPEGMHKLTVPASTWLIMSGEGKLPDAIQNTWKESFEILLGSGYKQIQSTCFERYLDFEEDYTSKFEVWMAVEKID